nr:MAG TPA: ParB protein [Caudoviricetes sp.]
MFNLDKKIVKVKIGDLKPFGGNPRHNNESAKQVAKSIESFGYINPIVVDDEFVILAGNTRFKAIQLLGLSKEDEIDVLQVCGLTNEQKRGFVIADNRVAEYSKWNMSALDRMLGDGEMDMQMLADFGILNVKATKKKLEKELDVLELK